MLARRLAYPRTDGVIIRKTLDDLRDNHIIPMLLQFPFLKQFWNKQEKTMTLPNLSRIRFISFDNYDDVFGMIGKEFSDIMIDQAEQFSQEQIEHFRTNNRCTTNDDIVCKMLLTFNPGGLGHSYLKRIFVEKGFMEHESPDEFYYESAYGWDNVRWADKYLKENGLTYKDYYSLTDDDRFKVFIKTDYGRILDQLPEMKRRAQLLGDFDVFEGQFFAEFRRDVHVIQGWQDVPEGAKVIGVVDFGAETALELGYRDYDGNVVIFDECYTEQMNPSARFDEMATLLLQRKLVGIHIYCDTNMSQNLGNYVQGGEKTPLMLMDEVMQQRMGRLKPLLFTVQKSLPNYRAQCNEAVREYLHWRKDKQGEFIKKPKLFISSQCRELVQTLPLLMHDSQSPDGLDFVQKRAPDHCYDAMKYLLMELRTPVKPEACHHKTFEELRSEKLNELLKPKKKVVV